MFRSTGFRIRAVAASLVLAAGAVPGVSQAFAPTTTSINLGRITDAANLTAKLGKNSQGTYTAGSNPAYIVREYRAVRLIDQEISVLLPWLSPMITRRSSCVHFS